MSRPTFLTRSLSLVAVAALAACGGGGDDDDTRTVSIEFAAVAGSTPVQCGTVVTGLGSGAADAQIQDMRFYVSNVSLLKDDGSEAPLTLPADDDWNHTEGDDRVTLIDLEDATGSCAVDGTGATHTTLTGTVPSGTYVGVKMTLGVPFSMNHTDTATAPAPLDILAMGWNWQFGRKHAKIEVTDPAGATGTWPSNAFYVHLGSTGCTGNPASGQTVACTAPNRMDFHFHAFDPATQRIALDLQALLAGNDITVNQAGAPGCMSGGDDPECAKVFESMQIDWKPDGSGTGLPIDEGHAQTLFKAIAK